MRCVNAVLRRYNVLWDKPQLCPYRYSALECSLHWTAASLSPVLQVGVLASDSCPSRHSAVLWDMAFAPLTTKPYTVATDGDASLPTERFPFTAAPDTLRKCVTYTNGECLVFFHALADWLPGNPGYVGLYQVCFCAWVVYGTNLSSFPYFRERLLFPVSSCVVMLCGYLYVVYISIPQPECWNTSRYLYSFLGSTWAGVLLGGRHDEKRSGCKRYQVFAWYRALRGRVSLQRAVWHRSGGRAR